MEKINRKLLILRVLNRMEKIHVIKSTDCLHIYHLPKDYETITELSEVLGFETELVIRADKKHFLKIHLQ